MHLVIQVKWLNAYDRYIKHMPITSHFFGHLLLKKLTWIKYAFFFFKCCVVQAPHMADERNHCSWKELFPYAGPYQRQIHTHPISHISPARSTSNHSEWKKEQEKDSFSFKPNLISTSVHLLTSLAAACHTSFSHVQTWQAWLL